MIAVNSLAFKRFLDIARLLRIDARVVTDNDGDAGAVTAKYADYAGDATIAIYFDPDEQCQTLEQQLLKANGRTKLNAILGTAYEDEDLLLNHMGGNNKAETALRIFDSDQTFTVPEYIRNAIG